MVFRVTPSDHGFGLVEMLVVVAIVSIVAVGTSLLAVRSGGAASRATDMLQTEAVATRHLAMLSGLDHALIFSETGWQVSRRSGGEWKTLSTSRPAALSLKASQTNWVFRSDGGASALELQIKAAGKTVDCRSAASLVLECR